MKYPQIFNIEFILLSYLQKHNVNICFRSNPKLANSVLVQQQKGKPVLRLKVVFVCYPFMDLKAVS